MTAYTIPAGTRG